MFNLYFVAGVAYIMAWIVGILVYGIKEDDINDEAGFFLFLILSCVAFLTPFVLGYFANAN